MVNSLHSRFPISDVTHQMPFCHKLGICKGQLLDSMERDSCIMQTTLSGWMLLLRLDSTSL
jgi:hypothetical protein